MFQPLYTELNMRRKRIVPRNPFVALARMHSRRVEEDRRLHLRLKALEKEIKELKNA